VSTKGLPTIDGLDPLAPAPAGRDPASRAARGASTLDREALFAAAQFTQALENAPDDVDILLTLGRCLIWLGDPLNAGEVFRRILTLEPGNLVAAVNLRRLQSGSVEPQPVLPRGPAPPPEAVPPPHE
jgi:hypothetical protein